MTDRMAPALAGVTVVETTTTLGGQYGGRILSDLGADVIKIEPLPGDPWRWRRQGEEGIAGAFISANAGKRSICVDESSDDGRAIIGALLRKAEIAIVDDGSAELSGKTQCPPTPGNRLIITVKADESGSVPGGYLRTGESAVDLELKSELPGPVIPTVALCEVDTGTTVALAALSWLLWSDHGDRTGARTVRAEIDARSVGVSLLRQDLARSNGQGVQRQPFTTMRIACLDGYAIAHISAGADAKWQAVVGNRTGDLRQDIALWAKDLTRAEVERLSQDAGLPVGSVLSVKEALRDPQLRGRGYIDDSSATSQVTAMLPFLEFERGRWYAKSKAPLAGEHSASICEEVLDMNPDQRAKLFQAGVLR